MGLVGREGFCSFKTASDLGSAFRVLCRVLVTGCGVGSVRCSEGECCAWFPGDGGFCVVVLLCVVCRACVVW